MCQDIYEICRCSKFYNDTGQRQAECLFFMCTARRLNLCFTSKAMSYTKHCHDIPTEEKWFLQCPPVHRGNWWCLKQL